MERLQVLLALPASSSTEIAGYRKATLKRKQMQETFFEILNSEQDKAISKVRSLLCL